MPLASMAARWQQALALRIPPPLVLLLCGLAGWALDWRWPLALLPQPVARLAGLALSLAGGGTGAGGCAAVPPRPHHDQSAQSFP